MPRMSAKKAAAVIAVGLFALIQYLNFTGFCYRELRYHSDQELIDAAVKYSLKYNEFDPGRLRYSSLADFYAANPKCCRIYRWGHHLLDDGLWTRLFGWHTTLVTLDYKVAPQGPKDTFSAGVVLMQCGGVVDFWSSVQ
jgi:hypothetical protein